MRVSNDCELNKNSQDINILSVLNDRECNNFNIKHDEASLEYTDQTKTRKRGRPKTNSYDDFSDIQGVTHGHDHLKCVYKFSEKHDVPNYSANYKGDCSLNESRNTCHYVVNKDNHKDLNEYKDGFKYYKDYKDKVETDTRLTSSSDVLSNFNYETIDNYQVSDNYDTIDNYTSDEYSTSLNEDNSEFGAKDSDGTFNLDNSRFSLSTSASSALDRSSTTFDVSSCFGGSSGFENDHFAKQIRNDKDLVESKAEILQGELDENKVFDSGKLVDSSKLLKLDSKSQDSNHLLGSSLDSNKLMAPELESTKSLELEKKSFDPDNMYVISEELRQSYIRQSKLLPKIRGVWFNSTVRRMGWVGQAYKKCKRIEKIFSINKHGFEGARKLAIAFRNSQKPTGKSDLHYPDVTLKDVIKPISQLRINLPRSSTGQASNSSANKSSYITSSSGGRAISSGNYVSNGPVLDSDLGSYVSSTLCSQSHSSIKDSTKSLPSDLRKLRDGLDRGEPPDGYGQPSHKLDKRDDGDKDTNFKSVFCGDENEIDDYHYPVDYKEIIENYKSQFSKEEASVRDNTCREAILFMLYELSALLELDFPIPPIPKVDCKRGISFHINFLENSKKSRDLLPYINSLAHYICKGVTPTDMPHFQLYSLIRTLSHCEPLKMAFATQ